MDINWKEVVAFLVAVGYMILSEVRRRNETAEVKTVVEKGTAKAETAALAAQEKAETAATKMNEVYNVLNGGGILGALKSVLRQIEVLKDASGKRLKEHSTIIRDALQRLRELEKIVLGRIQENEAKAAAEDTTADAPVVPTNNRIQQ